MSIGLNLTLPGFAKLFATQSSIDNSICKWFGHRLNGKAIHLLKSEIEDTYHLLIEGREDLFPFPMPSRIEIKEEYVTEFMRRNSIDHRDVAKEQMHQQYRSYFISTHIIKYMSNWDDPDAPELLSVTVIHSWIVNSHEGVVNVSLLQIKENKSLVWRVTSGKVHMIVNGYCQTISRFPSINESNLDDMNTPIRWPLMINKIDQNFLKEHQIVDFEINLYTSKFKIR